MRVFRYVGLVAAGVSLASAALVDDVKNAAARNDFAAAQALLQRARAAQGETPETILALSWMARAALGLRLYQQAETYARDAYQKSAALLKTRPLDREPNLPTALGAAIEVQAMTLAAQGQRTEAVAYLEEQRKLYASTSIVARIQKNINLLSLVGKPAPPLRAASLPAGQPAVLFFWAHWCPDCRAEAPLLAALKSEFAPKGLAFIGITQKYGYIGGGDAASPSVELRYIEAIRQRYYSQIVAAPAAVSEDAFRGYGVSTTPTLTMVDRHGIVRVYHPGAMTQPELRAAIQTLVNTP